MTAPRRLRLPVLPEDPPQPSHRRSLVSARTVNIKRLSKRELERGRQMYPEVAIDRPMSREDCLQGPHAERPCPFVSCKHHLYLDVNERTGSIKFNFPSLEVWDLPETCALDLADEGEHSLEDTAKVTNVTRERIRQIERRALLKLRSVRANFEDLVPDDSIDDDSRYPALEQRRGDCRATIKRRFRELGWTNKAAHDAGVRGWMARQRGR